MRISYLEIYNEALSDLLNPKKEELKISEHYERGIYVDGLLEVNVGSPQQVLECLMAGQNRRQTGATQMNADSSRSHSIFRIVIESREIPDESSASDAAGSGGAVRVATLNLVDLAGSERVSQTQATGVRLKEGGAINRSLLYLAEVIHKLSERQCVMRVGLNCLTCILVSLISCAFSCLPFSSNLLANCPRLRHAQGSISHPVPQFEIDAYLATGARWKLADRHHLHHHAGRHPRGRDHLVARICEPREKDLQQCQGE